MYTYVRAGRKKVRMRAPTDAALMSLFRLVGRAPGRPDEI